MALGRANFVALMWLVAICSLDVACSLDDNRGW